MSQNIDEEVSKIVYNYLNLPQSLQLKNGHMIDNVPMGTIDPLSSSQISYTDVRDYVGNLVYADNGTRISRVLTPEGYVEFQDESNTPEYVFQLKDHLGSVCMEVDYEGEILSSLMYFPSGTEATSFGRDKPAYRYNGKEYEPMHDLNWYDYLARKYDPAIMRFTTVDPLAEKYYSISPYAYCANNPVKYIDPDGKDMKDVIEGFAHGLVGHDAEDPNQSDYLLDTGRWKDYEHQRVPGNSDYEAGYLTGEITMLVAEVVIFGGVLA